MAGEGARNSQAGGGEGLGRPARRPGAGRSGRRTIGRLAGALVAVVGVLGAVVVATASVASAGTFGTVEDTAVPLHAVACPTATTCVAVGNATVVDIAYGVPATSQSVTLPTKTIVLYDVACETASTCVAVGTAFHLTTTTQAETTVTGLVVPVTDGNPGTPKTVAGMTALHGATCPAATSCLAVGHHGTQAVVAPITNGLVDATMTVASVTSLQAVACASATSCLAVGGAGDVVALGDGRPGPVEQVATVTDFTRVSCPSVSTCDAVGSGVAGGVVVAIATGAAPSLATAPGTKALEGIACLAPSAPSDPAQCDAVGAGSSGTPTQGGAVVPLSGGTTGQASIVAGTSALFTLVCPTATGCLMVGARNGGGVVVPLTVRPTTTTLSASANPATAAQAVTYTAVVSPAPTTGTVEFLDAGVPIPGCTSRALSSGVATCTLTYPAASSHSITAYYSGDVGSLSSTSLALDETVGHVPTVVSLGASPDPAEVGQAVTLTATVTPAPTAGTVTFWVDGASACAAVTPAGGVAQCRDVPTTDVPVSVQASYSGDGVDGPSTSVPLTVTVLLPASTTTLTSTPDPAVVGEPVTYHATVSPAPAAGTVEFLDDGSPIPACGATTPAGGVATCTATYTSARAHSVVAVYSGSSTLASSTSGPLDETVGLVPTTTTLVSSLDPAAVGDAVTYTATVIPAPAGGTVDFLDDGSPVASCTAASLTGGAATCTLAYAAALDHAVVAVYSGDAADGSSSSSPLDESVVLQPTTTTLSTSADPAHAASEAVTYTVIVSPSPAGAGTVTFFDDGSPLAGCAGSSLATDVATCTVTYPAALLHSVVATFSGTASLAASTSAPLDETVQPTSTSIDLAASAQPVEVAHAVVYTATVTPTPGGGTVSFTDDGAAVASCTDETLTAGRATCSVTYITTASHWVVATYSGDDAYTTSTSPPLNETAVSVPGAPTGLTATISTVTASSVDLSWSAPASDGGRPVTGYDVYEGTTPGGEGAAPVNTSVVPSTTYTVGGLSAGSTVYFVVRALNSVGPSAPSGEASVTVPVTSASTAPTTTV